MTKKKIFFACVALILAMQISMPVVGLADANTEDSISFQILFTSDTHGGFDNYNYSTLKEMSGGLTKVATVVNQEREAFDGTTLVIDIGDTIQGNGTGYYIGNKEKTVFPNIAMFNHIKYDAVILGNHEFNFGYDALTQAYDGFSGPKLSANVKDNKGNLIPGFDAYHIFNINGLRVALIGIVTPNIDKWDPKTLASAGLSAYDAAETTKAIIKEIKEKDAADIIIAGGHMSEVNEFGRSGSGAIDVAQANPELAVFMGAHFHTMIGTKDNQYVLKGTDIKFVENINNAGSVGKIIINATKENGKWTVKNKNGDYNTADVKTDVIPVNNNTPIDAAANAAAKPYHDELYKYVTGTTVGKLEGGPLVPEPEIKGTYEGYLKDTPIADFLLKVVMNAGGDDVDIAGINIPDEYANLDPGDITIAGVSSIYKWSDTTMLYKLEMTGNQIKTWMEWSATYFTPTIDSVKDHSKPAFNPETDLTISIGAIKGYNFDMFGGVNYEIDLTKPTGERVNILSMADGNAFELNKTYTVVSNDYRATTHLAANSPDVFPQGTETAKIIDEEIKNENGNSYMGDFIIDYLAKQPNRTVQNTCDNNWNIVNLNWNPDMRALAVKAINDGIITTDFKTPVTVAQINALIDSGEIIVTPVSKVEVDKTELSLEVGASAEISATVYPEDATFKTLTWSTSDESVATVSNGVVTAVSEGSVVITAKTKDGAYAKCSVKITRTSEPPNR